ncbi:hypothetical protein BT93_D0375 [Corymbia citriodora subsp. variegata]|nr:hypothetical protein BT93_D0375 [Corymbia citriodora subsp. variegata]
MWLRSSTMPYKGAHRTDNHENKSAVKPHTKSVNGAAQQVHGKRQEQHEPEDGAEGVVEQQPHKRKHRYQTGEVEEEERCSSTRRSTAAGRWCPIMDTPQSEMQEQAADGDAGGDGLGFRGCKRLPLVFYLDEVDQDGGNGGKIHGLVRMKAGTSLIYHKVCDKASRTL